MGSLLLIIILLLGTINGVNLYQMEKRTNVTLKVLSENQGKFPKFERKEPPHTKPELGFQLNEETPFETRYFIVKTENDGSIKEIDTSHIAAVSSENAIEYADKVMQSRKDKGYEEIYKYLKLEQEGGYIIIFVDCRMQIQTAKLFLITSIVVALFTLILMFVLISVFSKRAIKPIIESTEKQKQFITDAGHEIKTPIAIISANTDVLELIGEKNEWTTSIRNQTNRLEKLVKNLLLLSKMDEENTKLVFSELDISEVVYETALSFKTLAEMQNKTLHLNIVNDLILKGDEVSIQQLISTLLDNAVKYSDEGGSIKVSLASTKKGLKLEVYNTSKDLKTDNLNRLFDRFYRADSSRARETGGYGIGLSIAKSIVEAHNGKISVKGEDKTWVCFTIVF